MTQVEEHEHWKVKVLEVVLGNLKIKVLEVVLGKPTFTSP
jgi:hypothetical protein